MSSNVQSTRSALLREVQGHIQKLEEGIKRVSSARKHLKQSSLEVKSDIQTTMTHQLEALRERELYLLRQVDLTEQARDSALQAHQDSLTQALGRLKGVVTEGSGGVEDTLNRLKNLDLHPKQTPHIAFKANVAAVNDVINNFGSVDVQKISLSKMFGGDSAATSLPRSFEDYNDEEHHVLYRAITDDEPDTRQICVTIPPLSKTTADWLLPAPVTTPTTPTSPCFPPFTSPGAGLGLAGWLGGHEGLTRSVSSAASIHQWLCDIQEQGGMDEEEDEEASYEVISPTATHPQAPSTKESSIEVLDPEEIQTFFFSAPPMVAPRVTVTTPVTPVTPVTPGLPYFAEITTEPAGRWLQAVNDDDDMDQDSSSADFCQDVLSYFRDVTEDTREWLAQYNKKRDSVPSCAALSSPPPCATVTRGPVDIENLHQLICVHDNDPLTYFSTLTSDPKSWLLADKKDEDGDLDESSLTGKCKANEPCMSFKECLADENCCSVQEKASVEAQFGYFDAVRRQTEQSWLLPGNREDKSIEANAFPGFPVDSGSDVWLNRSADHKELPEEPSMFKTILQTPSAEWLNASHNNMTPMKTSTSTELNKMDFLNNFLQNYNSAESAMLKNVLTTSDWLHPDNLEKNQSEQKEAKTISWLLTPKQELSTATQTSKEAQSLSFGKHSELPECEDEPTSDVLFSCFQTKPIDNNVWLSSSKCSNMLVD